MFRAEELALNANPRIFAPEELGMEIGRDLRLLSNGEGLGGTEAGGDTTIPSPNISCASVSVCVYACARARMRIASVLECERV